MLSPETPLGNQFERMKRLGNIPSLNAAYLVEPKPTGYERTKIAPPRSDCCRKSGGRNGLRRICLACPVSLTSNL